MARQTVSNACYDRHYSADGQGIWGGCDDCGLVAPDGRPCQCECHAEEDKTRGKQDAEAWMAAEARDDDALVAECMRIPAAGKSKAYQGGYIQALNAAFMARRESTEPAPEEAPDSEQLEYERRYYNGQPQYYVAFETWTAQSGWLNDSDIVGADDVLKAAQQARKRQGVKAKDFRVTLIERGEVQAEVTAEQLDGWQRRLHISTSGYSTSDYRYLAESLGCKLAEEQEPEEAPEAVQNMDTAPAPTYTYDVAYTVRQWPAQWETKHATYAVEASSPEAARDLAFTRAQEEHPGRTGYTIDIGEAKLRQCFRAHEGGRGCFGPVEWRTYESGRAYKNVAACLFHFELLLEVTEHSIELASDTPPEWFDETYAGERWDDDY
jgi:hypothetical protein